MILPLPTDSQSSENIATEAEVRLMNENARLTREPAGKKHENDFLKKSKFEINRSTQGLENTA